MAMGKTVLVGDVGGLRELVIGGQNDIIDKSGDVNDLAEKLIHLAVHPGQCQKIGFQDRKDKIAKKDWFLLSQEYRGIYGGLLNSNA